MKLVRLGASTLKLLRSIERTPHPPPYVAEVEEFVLGRGAATHILEPLSAVLFADDSSRVVGAAIHYQDSAFVGAQYIAAVLVDHRVRGSGLGRALLLAVIEDARRRSGHEYVRWMVHPDNTSMLQLSRSVPTVTELGLHQATGYVEFIQP